VSPSTLDQAPGALACLFELASHTFAVEIGQAREARVFTDYTVVPLAPPHLIGMTNLRGAIIPIVDLGVLLGLPARRGTISALVVEANAVRVALAVDRVLGVEALERAVGHGESDLESARLESGHVRRGNDDVPILDVVKIVESLA
jgi:purine-binding chemotaxis protein CheW